VDGAVETAVPLTDDLEPVTDFVEAIELNDEGLIRTNLDQATSAF